MPKRKELVRCPWATSSPLEQRLSRRGVGRSGARRGDVVRIHHARRRTSRTELGYGAAQARALSQGLRRFRPARVAKFTPARIEKILTDPGVIRHRGKLESAVTNAQAIRRDCCGVRFVRRLPLGFHRRDAAGRAPADARRGTGRDPAVGSAEQRPAQARPAFRRPDDRLRVHASGRASSTTTSPRAFATGR